MFDRRSLLFASLAAGLPAAAFAAEPGRGDADMVSDWPWLGRYAADNARLIDSATKVGIVFIGDSITEGWPHASPQYFRPGWINRGIGGQTSPQILLRFTADVVALRPRHVHILAGTNDIAGNTGPIAPEATVANIVAMALLARAHGIRPVIGTVLPVTRFGWRPEVDPAGPLAATNRLLRDAARVRRMALIDYFGAMADGEGRLPHALGEDGVHPNAAGYRLMEQVLMAKAKAFRG